MIVKVSVAAVVAGGGLAACGHGPGGKLMVESPIAPYRAPDISDITGNDDDDDAGSAATTPTATPAPATPAPAAGH